SSAGMEPNSTFPKKDGATTMYHAFPRHLSFTCLVFEDKVISPNAHQDSQRNIKRFMVSWQFSLCYPYTSSRRVVFLLFRLLADCFQSMQLWFCPWLQLSSSRCVQTPSGRRLLF